MDIHAVGEKKPLMLLKHHEAQENNCVLTPVINHSTSLRGMVSLRRYTVSRSGILLLHC